MPATVLRTPVGLFAIGALLLALTSCGGNSAPIICEAPASSNSSTCTCGGTGTAACPVNPGPEFLYAYGITGTGGQISAFSVDRSSGTLTRIGSVPGPSGGFPTVGLAAVNNQFLFASDRSQPELDGFSIDQTTGALSAVAGSPFQTGAFSAPGGLASPLNSSFLYVADAGDVDAFTVSSTGVPAAISGSPFHSGSVSPSLAVDPSGGFLYAPDADLPGVTAFTIGSTGALTQVAGSPFTIPGQTDGLPWGIVDTGSYVYTTLSIANQVAAFSIVSGTGALNPVPNSPFPAGTNPTALVAANGFLYAVNEGGTISGYSINSNGGALTPLSGSPFAIVGLSMATDTFGQHLYVADGVGVQAFTVNSTSGALTPLSGSPFVATGATVLTVVQIPPL